MKITYILLFAIANGAILNNTEYTNSTDIENKRSRSSGSRSGGRSGYRSSGSRSGGSGYHSGAGFRGSGNNRHHSCDNDNEDEENEECNAGVALKASVGCLALAALIQYTLV